MHYREPFYVYPRQLKSGKRIYYYQVYLEDGSLSSAKTTGQTSKGAAKAFCKQLEKEHRLIPQKHHIQREFKEYFKNWWDWGPDLSKPTICPHLTRKALRGQNLSYAQARLNRTRLKTYIFPHFGDLLLYDIKTKDVELWLDSLANRELSGKFQVALLSLLRVMMKEACRLGDLEFNPVLNVIPPLKSKPKKRGILSPQETEALFSMENLMVIWSGDYQAMGAFMLARDTAMRPGEVRAMQRKFIHFLENGECQIDIMQAVDHVSHLIKETKTGAVLEGVPVRRDTAAILRMVCNDYPNPKDLIFSKDGEVHVSENYLKRRLYRALEAIGISEEQRRDRNITPYSFRNLAITRLRQQSISDVAVRSLSGIKTTLQIDGYTSFNDEESINQIRDFYKFQDKQAGGF
ncbi:MAG: tyrosine-type recombinase/integrase [Spirochaetaceae bacterium]|jgi:integrase|nr:tyrosine-type recombinase/integrase [Spirochaetaceae bacterium]